MRTENAYLKATEKRRKKVEVVIESRERVLPYGSVEVDGLVFNHG